MEAAARNLAIYAEIPPLAQKIKDYIKTEGIGLEDIAQEIQNQYKRPTISRYLSGKYTSDATAIEERLSSWLAERTGEPAPLLKKVPTSPRFFRNRDARQILGVCESCQANHEMGIIIGESGFGKTYALKTYAKLERVVYIECGVAMSPRDLLETIQIKLGLRRASGSNQKRINAIIDHLITNPGYLIIFDEADKLMSKSTQNKMQIIREIFDKTAGDTNGPTTCGIVLAGEPNLEVFIENYVTQAARRIMYRWSLQGLAGCEVEDYLADYDIEEDALAILKKRACNSRSGCFRLLDRTMRNVADILRDQENKTITLKVAEGAVGIMMLRQDI